MGVKYTSICDILISCCAAVNLRQSTNYRHFVNKYWVTILQFIIWPRWRQPKENHVAICLPFNIESISHRVVVIIDTNILTVGTPDMQVKKWNLLHFSHSWSKFSVLLCCPHLCPTCIWQPTIGQHRGYDSRQLSVSDDNISIYCGVPGSPCLS